MRDDIILRVSFVFLRAFGIRLHHVDLFQQLVFLYRFCAENRTPIDVVSY